MGQRYCILLAALMIAVPAAAQNESEPRFAGGQEPEAPSSVRPDDDSLTCEQLLAESLSLQSEMDAMSNEIQSAALEQMRAARSAQATSSLSSVASMIPVIGGLVGQIGSMATQAQVGAQQDRMLELSERMMVRGSEIGQRLNRVEILRSARCGTGQPPALPTQVMPDENPATGR